MKKTALLASVWFAIICAALGPMAAPSAFSAPSLLSIKVDATAVADPIEGATGIEITVNHNDLGFFSENPPWYINETFSGLPGFLGMDWVRNSYANGKLTYSGTDPLGGDAVRALDGLVFSDAAGPPVVTNVKLTGYDGVITYGITPPRTVNPYDYYELYIILTPKASAYKPKWAWPASASDWPTSTPEAQYMDAAILNQMMAFIEQEVPKDTSELGNPQIATHSVIVIRRGHIVLEEYPNPRYNADSLHIVNSVTKSFVSALVGIAIDKDLLSGVDQRMVDLFPEIIIQNLNNQKQRVTLDHMLKMQAGLQWDEWAEPYTGCNNDYINALWCQIDPVQYILNLPMTEEPGTRWNYNGGTSHLLSSLIASFTDTNDTLAFAREFLLNPMGVSDSSWDTASDGIPQGGGGLWLKPRDLARFGYLYLNKGAWDQEQIVSEDFVTNAVATYSILYATQFGARGYGYQSWWTYPAHGIYYADGLNGQKIYVVPELDLVVVFTAHLTEDPGYWQDRILFDFIIPAADPIPATLPWIYLLLGD